MIDAGFAHSKRLYRRSDVDLLQDIAEIVDKSTASNKAVVMKKENNELEWEWRDWKTFFACHFKPLKGIRQYQQFRFSSDHPGCVFVKKNNNDAETKIKLLKSNVKEFSSEILPLVLPSAGFSSERLEYFRNILRRYVRPAKQDIFCATVNGNEE